MSIQRGLWALASCALAVFLILLLIKVGNIDLSLVKRQLQDVNLASFSKLVLLNILLVYLSSEKWRGIDAAWRKSSESAPSKTVSFAITSAGLAIGTFLPVQIAMGAMRTLGTYVHGSALKRGLIGTLYEQSFDLLIAALLTLASGFTWLNRGGALLWTTCAVTLIGLAVLAARPLIDLAQRLALSRRAQLSTLWDRLMRHLWEFQQSGLLNAGLARRLILLSAARLVVVVLMSMQTAGMVGARIDFSQMAMAIPLVMVASLVALTPGGLGINELSCAAALKMAGIPLTIGAQWALANRVLVAASYCVIALGMAVIVCGEKMMTPNSATISRES